MKLYNYLKEVLSEIDVKIRTDGCRSAVYHIIQNIYFKIGCVNLYLILSKNVEGELPSRDLTGDFLIKIIEVYDKKLFKNNFGPLSINKFKKRIADGKICMVCMEKDRVVCYTWVGLKGADLVDLEEDEAYLFDAYTYPQYRGRGIHTLMSIERLKYVRSKGYKRAVAGVGVLNSAVQRVLINDLGFEVQYKLLYLKFLKRKFRYIFDK